MHELIYCSINNFSLVSLDFFTCLLGDIKIHIKIFTDTTIFEIEAFQLTFSSETCVQFAHLNAATAENFIPVLRWCLCGCPYGSMHDHYTIFSIYVLIQLLCLRSRILFSWSPSCPLSAYVANLGIPDRI